MVEYTCKKCQKKFDKKTNYLKHINRKTSCIKNNKSESNKCEFCETCYSRKDSLKRHLAICKKKINKKNVTATKNSNSNIVGRDYIDKSKNVINKNNNININFNDNVKVVLLNFPSDKCAVLDVLGKILESKENINVSMVKNVNINEEKPEHHNIYYPDIKSSHGEIYTNNKWNTKRIDEILNLLLETNTDILDKILNELGKFLNDETRERIKESINDVYNMDGRKKLKSYLKILLYDGKDVIKKTRKTTDDTITNNEINNSDDASSITSKRELALYFLGKINNDDEEEHEIMRLTIKRATDPHVLDVITRLLCKIIYMNSECKITRDTINDEIKKEKEIEELLK